ncbi:MAG: hypothetical protein KDB54_10440 [Solirubrobacterales bacterium]|nr:hypothetical protein [Solirubrobacterales bacterium]
MLFLARRGPGRGLLPALLACLVVAPFLVGCGEDRSNLIPKDTSESLIARFDRIQSLAAAGECFQAAKVARTAQQEIEAMGTDVDAELKRSLLDGVTDLTLLVNDPDKCTEADTTTTEVPVETEETPTDTEGTTGETGTTDTSQATTGDQGTTDENQDSNQTDNNGNGNQTTPPATNPTTPTTPTTPTEPTTPTNPSGGTGPGSGGLGPG